MCARDFTFRFTPGEHKCFRIRRSLVMREADMNHRDLGCLAVAITCYLTSKYFTELAPGTQSMRRNLLKNVFAEVERLSAAEISEARNEIPSETPTRSVPWRPVHQRRNWTTA